MKHQPPLQSLLLTIFASVARHKRRETTLVARQIAGISVHPGERYTYSFELRRERQPVRRRLTKAPERLTDLSPSGVVMLCHTIVIVRAQARMAGKKRKSPLKEFLDEQYQAERLVCTQAAD
jgi:hypothetical protein